MPSLLTRPHLRSGPNSSRAATAEAADWAEPEVITAAGVRWLHIEHPLEEDRDWLEREFGFHHLAIEDVASRNQRPKLDAYDDYLFIVLHFPVFDKPSGRLLTAELDLFVGPDYLITLPDHNLPPLAAMFERYREREEVRQSTFSKGTGYLLYRIVDTCVDASFPMLRKMGAKLDDLEDDIFEGRSDKIVQDISNAKQEIINFRRVVRPMRAVLRDLERTKQRYLADDLDVYFDDTTDAVERIWDILENDKEVVEALEDSNESVLSHQLNSTLRVLTAFSVALLPLTLVASIFGMNFDLPGDESLAGVLDRDRGDGPDLRRRPAVLPPPRLPLGLRRGAHPRFDARDGASESRHLGVRGRSLSWREAPLRGAGTTGDDRPVRAAQQEASGRPSCAVARPASSFTMPSPRIRAPGSAPRSWSRSRWSRRSWRRPTCGRRCCRVTRCCRASSAPTAAW